VAHHHRIQYGTLVKFKVVLAQNGHPLAGINAHGSGIRVEVAGQNFQKGRFTRAVGTDNTVTVTRRKADIHFIKQYALAVPEGYIICCNHGSGNSAAKVQEINLLHSLFVDKAGPDKVPETARQAGR
jgi:hypothetical protein